MLFAVVYIFSNDLQNALALNAFDLQTYTSGSVHYRLGAVALVLFAPAVAGFARARSRWLASAWWVLASVSAYGAVISGSRGVYVPFLLILGLTALRVFKRGRTPWRWVLGLVALFAVLVVTDVVVPFHPAAEALSAKATLDAQATAAASSGGFTQRLRFWDQGLSMAWQHPSGVGLGAFRDTIHAFQRFPMVWSSSPHNIFVETVATVGVPGLTVLLILLGHAFVVGWQSRRWPWALAMLGIWSTLAVDVTADYPSMMAVAFATVGACLGPSATRFAPPVATAWRSARLRTLGVWLASLTVALGAALTVWWFSPCEGSMCALTQGRGVEYQVLATSPRLPVEQHSTFFRQLERLYPDSLWVLQLELKYAPDVKQRLALAAEIARRFPLQSWRNYLMWANLSLSAGDLPQAKAAVNLGLGVFGPKGKRYPERRADPVGFQHWLARAHEILAMTASP